MGLAFPEIKQKGWNALIKELGYAGATKFMLLYEPGEGNYTERRKEIFKNITIEKVREEIVLKK
jgi:tagatose-1,6-bisphosphate aldolase